MISLCNAYIMYTLQTKVFLYGDTKLTYCFIYFTLCDVFNLLCNLQCDSLLGKTFLMGNKPDLGSFTSQITQN